MFEALLGLVAKGGTQEIENVESLEYSWRDKSHNPYFHVLLVGEGVMTFITTVHLFSEPF